MRKILLIIGFLLCAIGLNAQTLWTLHSTPAQVRNAFNDNFNYVYANKADKTNPVVIGIIKISDGTNVTDTAALQSWVRDYVSTHGGGGGGSMTWPVSAGIPVYSGSQTWATSIPNNSASWDIGYSGRREWDGGGTGLVPANALNNLGGTTAGKAFFTMTNPGAFTVPTINPDNSVSALSPSAFKAALGIVDGGGVSDATMRAAIADSINELRSNAVQLSNVAVIKADSTTNKYATKYELSQVESGNWLDSLSVLSSNPTSGNVYIHSGDKKIHYKVGGYWHRLAILDSVAAESGSIIPDPHSAWLLNETSGTTATDARSVTNLTNSNATVNQAGKLDKCYSFNGTSSYVGWIDNTYEYSSAMTVSAWINPSSTAAYQTILSDFYASDDSGWELTIEYGDKPYFSVRDPAQTPSTAGALGTTVLGTGTWYQLVGTFDGTYTRIYVNGVLQGTSTAWNHNIAYNAAARFSIGKRYDGLFYAGLMDSPKTWPVCLTQTQITELYTQENAGNDFPY